MNVSNLTLIGRDGVILDGSPLGIPMATSRVSCRRGKTLFSYSNVTELFIARLTFSECGKAGAALFLNKVSNLVLDSVTIQNSTGTGLIGFNLAKSLIHHSTFMFNQATSAFPWSGNIMLFYEECSEVIETYTLNITSSWILFGNATTELTSTGGLSLQVGQSCYNVKVHIHNTTLKQNMGGNMFLLLNGFAHNIITITDSYFEWGYMSYSGGGVLIYTSYNASQVPQHVESNRVYINNTEFMGNQADSGGAMSVLPCTGTELNGSRFYNNTAHNGGHIAIMLVSHTCANVTITITDSLFEDGKATGSGGGVAVMGSQGDSQCTNGNYINISNTQFVANHAEFNGGAVLLWGCLGTELYIDESAFYNNTAALGGGHIELELTSNHAQFIVVSNSHFESGKAYAGGGILVFVGGSCTSVNSTICKSVYVMNSNIYRNVAEFAGGGMVILFKQSCVTINVLIHNLSLLRNTASNLTGGNIYLQSICTAGNSITISRSTVEFGTSPVGGGMVFLTDAFPGCPSSMINLKPTNLNIVDSTFQYNTAYKWGGGLDMSLGSSEYFCCSAEVNITNVTFFNNTASTFSYRVNGTELFTLGGNIFINDGAGQWLNNSVRIQSCLIEGGVAQMGGGIYVLNNVVCCQKSIEMEALIISNTRFICNQATLDNAGASLMIAETPNIYNIQSYSTTTFTYIKKLTITDTTFDGPCTNSSNVNIQGMGAIAPYLPTQFNVVFINVLFRGYSTNLSSLPSTIHSQQLFDDHIILNPTHTAAVALYAIQPLVMLSFIPNPTFIDCEFFESAVDGGLAAEGTNVFFGGNIIFRDNRAIYGGGLTLLDNSIMYLTPNTRITFSHNHATYAGGAIYVQSDGLSLGNLMCFYQFDGINQDISDMNIQITFENNTAHFAGSVLYGGLVDICFITISAGKNNDFDSIFKVQNTDNDPTAISSDPYRVCPCNDSRPVCGKLCNASNPHCSSNLCSHHRQRKQLHSGLKPSQGG